MKIQTLADITKLSEDEFERFIPDLRNYCKFHRNMQSSLGSLCDISSHFEWIDDGKNDAIIQLGIK